MYPLCVQKLEKKKESEIAYTLSRFPIHLANDITRLNPPDSLYELCHGTIIIAFRIKVVTVFAMNISYARLVQPLRLGHAQSHDVE